MALTLGNFIGFETGGLEEVEGLASSPAVDDAYPRTGRYCLECSSGDDRVYIKAFVNGTDQGDFYVAGFAFRTPDATPSTTSTIFVATDSVYQWHWFLRLTTTGYLEIQDNTLSNFTATTTQLQDNTWYYIEISWEKQNLDGQMDIYIDGVSELAITTADLDDGGALAYYGFGFTTTYIDTYFDDFYCYSGASSGATNMQGIYTRVIGPFANTEEDATDQGTTLTVGTWADTSEVPFNDSNYAGYDGNDDQGHTRFDEGRLENTQDAYKQFFTLGLKWISRNDYDGTKTPMYMRYGWEQLGSDWMFNESVTPTKAFVNYEIISAGDSSDDWMSLGHDNAGTGNDVRMSACVGMKLIRQYPNAILSLADISPVRQNSYGGPFSV